MRRALRDLSVAVIVLFGAACGSQPEADKATVGQDVAVTKADGGVVQGKVTAADDKTVQVTSGKTTKTIPKSQIANVNKVEKPAAATAGAPAPAPPPVVLPPAAKWREYTVPEGTKLSLKLTTAVSSATSKVEDAVEATLAEAVSVDGNEALPAGSVVKGLVSAAEGSGRVKGLASLTLNFRTVVVTGREDCAIDASFSQTAEPTKGSDAKKIGGGAAVGAVIGGLLGGKGGAAKGAAVGGGAGAGVVMATKGKEVEYAAGATLTVELKKAAEVKVPIK